MDTPPQVERYCLLIDAKKVVIWFRRAYRNRVNPL